MIGGTFQIDTGGFSSLVTEAKTRQITLKGAKAGIRVLQAASRAAAPRRPRSGALKSSQGVLAKKGRKGLTVSFAVQGARKRVVKFVRLRGYQTPQKVVPAFYDHLVLGGTKAHRTGKGELLSRLIGGKRRKLRIGTAQTTGARHPGTQPNPYRKRAWNAVKGQVANATKAAMKMELNKIIHREAAKLHRRKH